MPSEPMEFAPLHASTHALPVQERVPFWREVFGRKFCNFDIAPLSDGPFAAEVTLRAWPELRTMTCICSAAHLQRTRELVAAAGDDSIMLPMSLSGSATLSQRGREVSLGPGDAVPVLHAEPSTMTHSRINGMSVGVPCAALAPLVRQIEDAAMRVIPRDHDALRLLRIYLDAMHKEIALATPELRRLVASHVRDLVALALGATRDGAALAAERGLPAARLAAIKTDILARLGSRELTLTALAARHKVSQRSIQLLFEREGMTFSRFVLEQRLARAHDGFVDPANAGVAISTIALAAGFGDLSHFNRSFRRHYGATPSDVRAGAPRIDHASRSEPSR